ncbi:MAG: hypothetical protein ACUVXG_13670, partial [Anaerolineae bacterium]
MVVGAGLAKRLRAHTLRAGGKTPCPLPFVDGGKGMKGIFWSLDGRLRRPTKLQTGFPAPW